MMAMVKGQVCAGQDTSQLGMLLSHCCNGASSSSCSLSEGTVRELFELQPYYRSYCFTCSVD